MLENFIPLNRNIQKHWIYTDSHYLHVWLEMLIRARYSKEPSLELIEGQLIEISYAEFVFGRKKWSEKIGISEQRLRTLIKKMVDEGMIEPTSRFNKFSLYRIKNYEKYNHHDNQHNNQQNYQSHQGFLDDFNQQESQQDNQQSTNIQPASNQQVTTKEERLKEREERSKKEETISPDVSVNLQIEDLRKRYTTEQLEFIDEYFDMLRHTRRSAKIAQTVILKIYKQFDKFPPICVEYGVRTHTDNVSYHSKQENYTIGIVRNTSAEEALKKLMSGKNAGFDPDAYLKSLGDGG